MRCQMRAFNRDWGSGFRVALQIRGEKWTLNDILCLWRDFEVLASFLGFRALEYT